MILTYIIFSTSELGLVDFSQVIDDSQESVAMSLDGTKCIVKWAGDQPSFVDSMTTVVGKYTQDEILTITQGPDWNILATVKLK